jgi:hypothetical protein
MIAVLASIGMLSYNQTEQLFAYILSLLYYSIRYYSHVPDLVRFARVTGYFGIAMIFIYFFARSFNQRDRETFVYSRK